jgi:hypothetical protein
LPEGIVVLRWNERSGIEIKTQYPDNIIKKISEETLLHLVNMHGFDKETGVLSLTTEKVNFCSYYGGTDKDYYILLILNILENPEDFEERFEQTSLRIIENLKDKKYREILFEIFQQLNQK